MNGAVEIGLREGSHPTRMDHLEQDPLAARQAATAADLALGQAWLREQADKAVTDQALHALCNEQAAGRCGRGAGQGHRGFTAAEANAVAGAGAVGRNVASRLPVQGAASAEAHP